MASSITEGVTAEIAQHHASNTAATVTAAVKTAGV
jgi:hypothetical protein